MNEKKIPFIVIPRLSRYYRALFEYGKKSWISSNQLSEITGFSASQIRKDLTYFGQFGLQGRGYDVEELRKSIKKILGLDQKWNVALVGAGNLGTALVGYRGFHEQGFEMVAAFDNDESKVGRTIHGIKIYDISELPKAARKYDINIALITVPEFVAQHISEEVVAAGIHAILNFAPVNLKLPGNVKILNIDMTMEIQRLSFLISKDFGRR
jgi:redox-sensing transcriptional repressor